MAPQPLNDIVKRAVRFLSSEAASKRVGLGAELADDLPDLVCDGGQIYQVCLNLLMNAVQACDGGGDVTVVTRSDHDTIHLVVRDTGVGIPAELEEQLFTPFTSARKGGIGLGLAIVKRVVAAHGGEIVAHNTESGAEFHVHLPLNADNARRALV
jgi:signal transduction histidine kinase